MPSSRMFLRSPRLLPHMPGGEVEIQAPPTQPAEPQMTLASVLWPMVPGVLAAIVMYSLATANGGSGMSAVAYSIPILAASYLVQVGRYYFERKRYYEDSDKREQMYRKELEQYREHLQRSMQLQQTGLLMVDPDPTQCLARVSARSDRLWERSPEDWDFLSLRLGLGAAPFRVKVKVPRQQMAIEPDPLLLAAQALGEDFQRVEGVPVCLSLRTAGVVGICGPRPAAIQAGNGLALQLATHHAPTEVKLLAIFAAEEADHWAWLRWLPHVWSVDRRVRYIAADRWGTRKLLDEAEEILIRRKQLVAMNQEHQPLLPALVFLVSDWRLIAEEPAVSRLIQEGPALGAYTVILAGRKEDLPKECRVIADVTSCTGALVVVGPSPEHTIFLPDEMKNEVAEQLARSMAPIQVHQTAAATDIPRVVPLLALLDARRVDDLNVLRRWQENQPHRSLAVPIGLTAGAKAIQLDLHERGDGPHGLVAGATGSGKSELLQTYMASLAIHFHPHELAFLVIDYKGGGLADVFHGLPHLLATLTNLDGRMSMRALVALKAELKRRMQLLREAGVNHVDEYIKLRRQGRDLRPIPHLLVLVDEFAELKKERPEFMAELISAVRVGRSLGVHLILATQKPAGVVDDQIWGNTRFRLCLRVEQPGDSQEVLRCPDAVSLRGAGRGFLQVGMNERFELFQAGWGGAPYRPDAEDLGRREVSEVSLEGQRFSLSTGPHQTASASTIPELTALVAHVSQIARTAGIEPLQGPWQPPLQKVLALAPLLRSLEGWDGSGWRPTSSWLDPVFGLLDDPENQKQVPLSLNLGRDGHLIVFGASGMGKTTFIQTMAISLAHTHSPSDMHMYFVDCGGRALKPMSQLPHTGAVVLGDESERVERLMDFVLSELDRRKECLADVGVNNVAAFRRVSDRPMPGIILFFDNYPALATTRDEVDDFVALVTREGGSHGIHIVITANAPVALRYRVTANISQAICLSMVDSSDYSSVVGHTNGLMPTSTPGRGLVKATPPLEFQTALPAPGDSDWERTSALRVIMDEMAQAWQGGPKPVPVRQLPEAAFLHEVTALDGFTPVSPSDGSVPLGLDVRTLEPFSINLFAEGPHALVVSPVAEGKTTVMQTWLLSLANSLPPNRLELWIGDLGGGKLGPLHRLPHTKGVARDGERFSLLSQRLEEEMERRRGLLHAARQKDEFAEESEVLADSPLLVLAVDNADWLVSNGPDALLDQIDAWVRKDRGLGLHVIMTGSAQALSQSNGPIQAIRESAIGVVLGNTTYDQVSLFSGRLPAEENDKLLPQGVALFMRRGRYRKVKVATAMIGTMTAPMWVERIAGRYANASSDPDSDSGR